MQSSESVGLGMKWFDDATERLFWFVAKNASGRGIVALMAVIYGGLGLALPILTRMSTAWLVSLNVIATILAATFGIFWFAVQVESAHRRHLVEWTSDLRLLDAKEFEWLVAEIYRREGWKVDETGEHGKPDGNLDLRMTRGKERAIVQCKRWTSWMVGVDDVRGFAGTVSAERGNDTVVGHFVTLSRFTEQAIVEGQRMKLVLVSGAELYNRAEKLRRHEACTTCGSPMVLDRSVRGWWFRCVTPGCTGKRDLGSQPARAVELLTEPPPSGPAG